MCTIQHSGILSFWENLVTWLLRHQMNERAHSITCFIKKGVEIGERQNRCHDDTLVDSDILSKMFSDLPKSMLWLKTRQFI